MRSETLSGVVGGCRGELLRVESLRERLVGVKRRHVHGTASSGSSRRFRLQAWWLRPVQSWIDAAGRRMGGRGMGGWTSRGGRDPEVRRCVALPGLVVERPWSWLQWCGWFAAWWRWGHLTGSPRMGLGSLMGAGISNDEKVGRGGQEGCSGPRTYIYVRAVPVGVRPTTLGLLRVSNGVLAGHDWLRQERWAPEVLRTDAPWVRRRRGMCRLA